MLSLFGRRRPDPLREAAGHLHDALIEQIRRPTFYIERHVPDTFEGRFDLLVLHLALAIRTLADRGADGQALSQALVDTAFARLDVAMRELGVSDIGVPKRMKRLAEAFKGRTAAYHAALARADHKALAAAIGRNVLSGTADGTPLARYALAIDGMLAAASLDDLAAGRLAWPDPTDAATGVLP